MYFDIRSDLACEMPGNGTTENSGSRLVVESHSGGEITRLCLLDEAAASSWGRAPGEYLTIDCGCLHLLPDSLQEASARLLSRELRQMAMRVTQKSIDSDFSTLVVGLGNAALTADAIGPATVAGLRATRHLRRVDESLYASLSCSSLAAIVPGVLGQTGIATIEIVKGVVDAVKPDLVVAVDALAARSLSRLSCTVQLCDSGISPGSGVGNHQAELSRRTLGVPVLSLGVPTVIRSAALVYDALQAAGIEAIDPRLEAILHEGEGMLVSPKESDLITQAFARLLANAISSVFGGL